MFLNNFQPGYCLITFKLAKTGEGEVNEIVVKL